MPEPDYFIKQGDFGETITAVLQNESLQVVDLTGGSVTFVMAPIQGGSPIISSAGTIIDGGLGQVGYVFQNGDTNTAGLYLAEFRGYHLGGAVQSFPNGSYKLVRVTPKLP